MVDAACAFLLLGLTTDMNEKTVLSLNVAWR